MQVPKILSDAFGLPFQEVLEQFVKGQGLIPDETKLDSDRFLSRSILPHVQKLSTLFNRREETERSDWRYLHEAAHPKNLRLAYFLSFMPPNLMRVASVFSELARLGWKLETGGKPVRVLEWGSGPAAGAAGFLAAVKYSPFWAEKTPGPLQVGLMERDKASLLMGSDWVQRYANFLDLEVPAVETYHRTLDLEKGDFLPRKTPSFHVGIMSFFLNELWTMGSSIEVIAEQLYRLIEKHLEAHGVLVLVEPALKEQSRKLLEIRRRLIEIERRRRTGMQVLLPCLGHQACGALEKEGDWCHEEVTWWRPPYLRKIDDKALLDRKTLPFSYLVLTKTTKDLGQSLTALDAEKTDEGQWMRLVSPSRREGRDHDFYTCSMDGKFRSRAHESKDAAGEKVTWERGDLVFGTELDRSKSYQRIVKWEQKK